MPFSPDGSMVATLVLVSALAVLPGPGTGATTGQPAAPATMRWGATGHRVIARVAMARLSNEAKREVRALLGRESLAAASTWADSIRNDRPATSPWHYVNIPVIDSVYRPGRHCPGGDCVVAALERQIAILADRGARRADRAEALRWVVHLVEDIHMPLHAGDRGDRGGNDVQVTFLGRPTNLHALWDSRLLDASGRDENQWVAFLERQLVRRGDLRAISAGTPEMWAMESHDVSREVVYPFLPRSLELDRRYYDQVHVVLEDRLLRASVRLSGLLDRIFTGR